MRRGDYREMVAQFEAIGLKVPPPSPAQSDAMTGRIRRYRVDIWGDLQPSDGGDVLLWEIAGPALAAMLIVAWVHEWSQPPVGSQLSLL